MLLLESPILDNFRDDIERFLLNEGSIPGFLASVTITYVQSQNSQDVSSQPLSQQNPSEEPTNDDTIVVHNPREIQVEVQRQRRPTTDEPEEEDDEEVEEEEDEQDEEVEEEEHEPDDEDDADQMDEEDEHYEEEEDEQEHDEHDESDEEPESPPRRPGPGPRREFQRPPPKPQNDDSDDSDVIMID